MGCLTSSDSPFLFDSKLSTLNSQLNKGEVILIPYSLFLTLIGTSRPRYQLHIKKCKLNINATLSRR